MLKIRLQGTTKDLKWFKKIIERDRRITVLSVSEPFANKGTNKYFRVYADIEKNKNRPEEKLCLKKGKKVKKAKYL